MPNFIEKSLADTLTQIALKQIEEGRKFLLPRLNELKKNEAAYFNQVPKTLKRRMNVPLPIMSGFVDTLVAKTDDPPTITYGPTELADLMKARKVSSLWQRDSGPTQGMWAIKDILGKKLAALHGRVVYEIYADSDPRYCHHLNIVDIFDFVPEPGGGWNLNDHRFEYKLNVFRSKSDLIAGTENGWYDKTQVEKLVNSKYLNAGNKELDEQSQREDRLKALGLNLKAYSHVGEEVYNFAEGNLLYNGTRYYLLCHVPSGIWVRAHEYDKVFKRKKDEPQLRQFVSWGTHTDAWNWASKAPADDLRPVHESMRVIYNEALNSLRRRNWNMRAVDTDIFPDLSQLEWREDGVVPVTASMKGKQISQGIYQFELPDTTNMTVNLMEFTKAFVARETGITPDVQGAADDNQKVGIYFGQLQQVADRLGLYNKFYRQCWAELGIRYVRGIRQHLPVGTAVKIIGSHGAEWEEFTEEDANPISDFDIEITGGQAELQLNEIKKKEKKEALIAAVSAYPQSFNSNTTAKSLLSNGGWEETEIRTLMDIRTDADQEVLAKADQAIQDILNKKHPRLFRGATLAFMEYIFDYAHDDVPLDKPELYDALIAYMQAHQPIVVQNLARKAAVVAAQTGTMDAPPGGEAELSATGAESLTNDLPPSVPPRVSSRGTVRTPAIPV